MADGYIEESEGSYVSKDGSGNEVPPEDLDIIKDAKEFYEIVKSVEHDQRTREEEDLVFEGVQSWTDDALESRRGGTDPATNKAIPDRPALSIPLLDQPIQQVISEIRQARLSIVVKPRTGLATSDMASMLNGLIRTIQADSGAEGVRVWGSDRTIKSGRGYYRIEEEFADDGDFDLDIRIRRILDQSAVYLDATAENADWSDGERGLIVETVTEDEHTRRWPKADRQPSGADAFDDENDLWYQFEKNSTKRMYMVATFWRVEYDTRELVYDPTAKRKGWMDELDEEQQQALREALKHPGTQARLREVKKRRVMRYVLDGHQILERRQEGGAYIPVIGIIGREYYVNGQHIWKGMVRSTMDVVRAYQVAVSAAVENAGTTSRTSWVAEEGQIENFEDEWEMSAQRAFAVLRYKATSIDGHPIPPPQRQSIEPALQGMLLLARSMKDDIGSLTGLVDPAFRAVNPYDRSGKAIEALQRQGAAGTSSFLDNLATISMIHEGKVIISKIPHVYDRPGRVIRVMTDEEHEEESAIMIKRPFITGPDGNPIPVPCPQCEGRGVVRVPVQASGPWAMFARSMMLTEPAVCPECQGERYATDQNMPERWGPPGKEREVKYVDFSKGQYKVTVDIGKSQRVAQEEARDAMEALAKAAPQLVPVYIDLYVRTLGFPGSKEIADRLQRTNPAANTPEGLEDAPPELVAQLEQMQAQHKAAVEEVQRLQHLIETDQVKANSQKELAMIKAHADRHLKALEFQQSLIEIAREHKGDEAIEEIKGQVKAMLLEMEQEFELMKQMADQRHEVMLERVKSAQRERESESKTVVNALVSSASKDRPTQKS